MPAVHRLFALFPVIAVAILATGLTAPAPAWAGEEQDCPNHPEATYTLSGDPDDARSELETLVGQAKAKGAVCIAAYYDSAGPAMSKLMAFRRANWAMEQLTDHGVPPGIIARALRASAKANDRTVQVILGP